MLKIYFSDKKSDEPQIRRVSAGQGCLLHIPNEGKAILDQRRPQIRKFSAGQGSSSHSKQRGKVVLDHDGLRSGRFRPDRDACLHIPTQEGKVVLDHNGLRSGDYSAGQGAVFTSHTFGQGKVVLDNDGLKSGRFGRTGSFFTSNTRGKVVLDHDGLRSGDYRPDRCLLPIPNEGKCS